ncbi:hypothetical protein, partial [Bacteroides heparinolyticus]|uniref:hypothetical protein n=1 Tax=Prevotella heparinolytica TaxID=28113 RepID=UPI0035A19D0C
MKLLAERKQIPKDWATSLHHQEIWHRPTRRCTILRIRLFLHLQHKGCGRYMLRTDCQHGFSRLA